MAERFVARLRLPAFPLDPADRRPPLLFWLAIVAVPTLVWLFVLPLQAATGPAFLDWNIYRHGFELWRSTGTPYQALPPGWDPFTTYPYLYPPSSWPLMVIAVLVPPAAAGLGALPLLLRPPRMRLVLAASVLLILGLGVALYLGNVNLIVAGLIICSFLPGRWGGLAFGALVGIKLYPIVLLPMLWSDRTRLRWTVGTLAVLFVSGTLFFGLDGWRTFVTTLLNEGTHPDVSWNPFASLGMARVIPAGLIVLGGLALRSPTVTLVGATWASGIVTNHYLITFAAALAVEPPIRRSIRHAAELLSSLRTRASRATGTAPIPRPVPVSDPSANS